MKKCLPIFAPGWMSMPVLRMGPLGHHPRDERDFQLVQQMGQAIDRDRLEARIAEDHFVEVSHGRVAVVGGLHVEREHLPQLGQLLQKLDRLGLAQGFEIGSSVHISLAPASCRRARPICCVSLSCRPSIRSPTW